MDHSFIVKLFKKEIYHRYKVKLIQEMNENDRGDVIKVQIFLRIVIFINEATFG